MTATRSHLNAALCGAPLGARQFCDTYVMSMASPRH